MERVNRQIFLIVTLLIVKQGVNRSYFLMYHTVCPNWCTGTPGSAVSSSHISVQG